MIPTGEFKEMNLISDNQATLHIASNPIFLKGRNICRWIVISLVRRLSPGALASAFVISNDQLADILTRSLRGTQFECIYDKLGAYDMYASASGSVKDIVRVF